MTADLLDVPLPTLLAQARQIRDDAHGRRVTFSPKVFIPLTMLCRDKCGYCTFAQPPARLESPFLSPDEVLAIARAGAAAGCHEALFTLGERPELRYPIAAEWLAANGHASTIDYLVGDVRSSSSTRPDCCPTRMRARCSPTSLPRFERVAPGQGMMLESLRDDLDCHRGSPDKTPERRLATLEAAGELPDPLHDRHPRRHRRDRDPTASPRSRRSRRRIARHGHVQEVIVQNFLPEARHRDAPLPRRARATSTSGAIAAGPRDPPAGRPRPGAAEPLRRLRRCCSTRASTTGAACRR